MSEDKLICRLTAPGPSVGDATPRAKATLAVSHLLLTAPSVVSPEGRSASPSSNWDRSRTGDEALEHLSRGLGASVTLGFLRKDVIGLDTQSTMFQNLTTVRV